MRFRQNGRVAFALVVEKSRTNENTTHHMATENENDLDPIEELGRQQREIEEKARTEAAKLEVERARLIEQRRPLNELQQKRHELAAKIERVKKARPLIEENATEFRQIVDRYLSYDTVGIGGSVIDLTQTITAWPRLANAASTLPHVDRWLKEKSNELAAIDAELVALANKYRAQGVLSWLLKGR
jgi:hypothetical protein